MSSILSTLAHCPPYTLTEWATTATMPLWGPISLCVKAYSNVRNARTARKHRAQWLECIDAVRSIVAADDRMRLHGSGHCVSTLESCNKATTLFTVVLDGTFVICFNNLSDVRLCTWPQTCRHVRILQVTDVEGDALPRMVAEALLKPLGGVELETACSLWVHDDSADAPLVTAHRLQNMCVTWMGARGIISALQGHRPIPVFPRSALLLQDSMDGHDTERARLLPD